MEVSESRYELSDESRQELPTQGVKRQELKGEEHCRELKGDDVDKTVGSSPLEMGFSKDSSQS